MVVGEHVFQLGVGVHLRANIEGGSAQLLEDNFSTEVEPHAGLGLQLYRGAQEVELVLHHLAVANAAEAAVVLEAGPELGGDVVADADIGLAGHRGGELQIDAGYNLDAHRHGSYREQVFHSGEFHEVDALLVLGQRDFLGEAYGRLRDRFEVAVDVGLQVRGHGEAYGLDAALSLGLDGVVKVELDGAFEVDGDSVAVVLAARNLLLVRQLGVGVDDGARLFTVYFVAGLFNNIVHSMLYCSGHLLIRFLKPVADVVEDAVRRVLTISVEFRYGEGLMQVVGGIPVAHAVAAVVRLSVECEGHGVDDVVVIYILRGLHVAEGSRPGTCLERRGGVVVDAGVERHVSGADDLGQRRAYHLQHVAVAHEPLLRGAAQVGRVVLPVPDTHGAVHEVGDAHRVGQCLADGELGGVGIVGHVVLGQEVEVLQSDGFAQRVVVAGYDQGGVFLRRVIVRGARGEHGCRGQHRGHHQQGKEAVLSHCRLV